MSLMPVLLAARSGSFTLTRAAVDRLFSKHPELSEQAVLEAIVEGTGNSMRSGTK